jgi:peptidoglycan/LPS O-acetylase OafA/YrhL
VEERFYLLWPALLWFVLKRPTGPSGGGNPNVQLKIAMALLFAISLAHCVLFTRVQPQQAFYLVPTRAWQFALGGLAFLKFVQRDSADDSNSRSVGAWFCAGWAGIGMIIGSGVWLDANAPYPGAWALVPSAGAALVLAAGAALGGARGIGRILSLRPMQAVGRVSYAWYLWHWPTLLLGATVLATANVLTRLVLAALSLVLALISTRFVENPIRRGTLWVARPAWVVSAAFATMGIMVSLALAWRATANERIADADLTRFERARTEVPAIYEMGCDEWFRSADVRVCAFGSEGAAHTAVAMGDSIGLQWFPAMAAAFDRPGWRPPSRHQVLVPDGRRDLLLRANRS